MQGSTALQSIVEERRQAQPYVLATGTVSNPDQFFLVVDCVVLGEVDVEQVSLILLAVYFVFNISYVKGCSNMFRYLEILFCKSNPDKASPTVKHFITALANH